MKNTERKAGNLCLKYERKRRKLRPPTRLYLSQSVFESLTHWNVRSTWVPSDNKSKSCPPTRPGVLRVVWLYSIAFAVWLHVAFFFLQPFHQCTHSLPVFCGEEKFYGKIKRIEKVVCWSERRRESNKKRVANNGKGLSRVNIFSAAFVFLVYKWKIGWQTLY